MTPCRLIIDPPQDGVWNMAVDEALLNDAAESGVASLRFYLWRDPTLSLGYFQSHEERQLHEASLGLLAVRRISGGGALLHDRELTYSLCLPAAHPQARDSVSVYEIVHNSLIGVLSGFGVSLALQGVGVSVAGTSAEPFLCFARRTAADVILPSPDPASSSKIVGSAQRRRRGAILQHGAVLLSASRFAPELAGVSECTRETISPEAIIAPWQEALAAALNLELRPCETEADLCLRQNAQRLQVDKYALRSWTERR
jgi:lipoate-protein ligase A